MKFIPNLIIITQIATENTLKFFRFRHFADDLKRMNRILLYWTIRCKQSKNICN